MFFKPLLLEYTAPDIIAVDQSLSFSEFARQKIASAGENVIAVRGFAGLELPDGKADCIDAFAVIVKGGGVQLHANGDRGICYAADAYADLMSEGDITEAFLFDCPDVSVRGYRVYLPGRAHFDVFRRMVDTIAYYRYNTMILEVGGAMEYDSHPEINAKWKEFAADMHSHSGRCHEVQFAYGWEKNSIHVDNAEGDILTKDEIRSLIAYINSRGMSVIPEAPTLSHTDYICLAHPELRERAEDPYPDTYCPSNEESYKIVFDILDEVIDVFKPEYINIGHDECYTIGLCEKCRDKMPAELYAGDITRIHDYLAARGVKTIMWGEKLLDARDENGGKCGGAGIDGRVPPLYECAKLLPRDITMFNWYWIFDSDYDNVYHENGYPLLFSNFDASECRDYRKRIARGIDGGFVSNWGSCEDEYMQRNMQYIALIFTAAAFWSPDYDDDHREAMFKSAAEEAYRLYSRRAGNDAIKITHTTDYYIPYKYFYDGIFIEDSVYLLGHYKVVYADGAVAELPVKYGTNISNEDIELSPLNKDYRETIYFTLAHRIDGKVWYETLYPNPHPESEIKSIEFIKTLDGDFTVDTVDKLKILLVIDQFFSANNGMTISARRFAAKLSEHGHEVRIVSTGKEGDTQYLMEKQRIPIFDGIVSAQGMTFAKPNADILREAVEWADVVHFLVPFALSHKGMEICEELGKPFTAAFHVQPENITSTIHMGKLNHVNDRLYEWFNLYLYRHCRHIHCPSNFIAEQLREHGYTGKLHVISNGIDPDFVYSKQPHPDEYSDRFLILSIGRLSIEKRQDVLIDAVTKSKYRDRITVLLAGQGPRRDKLAEQAAELNVPVSIKFYTKPELLDIISRCDLYVHAADAEIEAMACMEAFACGLVPVIADSPKSATPQFALDERSLFKAGDPTDLAARIDYWIEHPTERMEMELRYAESAKKYNLDECVYETERMFREAISENGGTGDGGTVAF